MKKICYFILVFLLNFANCYSSNICLYVSDSGHEFYYVNYSPNSDKHKITLDEVDFINAQGVFIESLSKDPNFNEEIMIQEVRKEFYDSITVLYNKNKEYMWEHFPQHKYTYDEFISIIKKFAGIMIFIGRSEYKCEVYMSLNIRTILSAKNSRSRIEEYPYILGYLYKDVKYMDGKKCKLQSIPKENCLNYNITN